MSVGAKPILKTTTTKKRTIVSEQKITTTQTGTPISSDEHSLTVGPNGPTVLHDRYLVEKLATFNRERVPERNPHAKGGGAFGEFEVTEDVSKYTRAAFLQPGAKSEMLARFSTVAGEQGSPDTWRDVRGFSLRFYTTDRKSTRLNSSHVAISYAVFCLKKKTTTYERGVSTA